MNRKLGKTFLLTTLLILIAFFAGCSEEEKPIIETITVTSSAFINWGPIPHVYTCSDKDLSPPLSFSNIPENVTSFAVIMDDIDAPADDFVHWIIWNIPKNQSGLSSGQNKTYPQGTNDFGTQGYQGPCPPSGTHRYSFTVYGLDIMLSLEQGATKQEFREAVKNHVLGQGFIIATYTVE